MDQPGTELGAHHRRDDHRREEVPEMSVVVVVTAFPLPGHRAEVIAAFEEAIAPVHYEPGLELYALHEGPDRLVMIEKYEPEQARSEHLQGAICFGGQAEQRSGRAGFRAAPGRKRAEGRAVTTVESSPGYICKRRVCRPSAAWPLRAIELLPSVPAGREPAN
jgi:hypothetical protein